MTMPLSSPTASVPMMVMRPRISSPAGGLRIQRSASTPTRFDCGQSAANPASASASIRVAPRLATWPISMSSKRAGIGPPLGPGGATCAWAGCHRPRGTSRPAAPYRFSPSHRIWARERHLQMPSPSFSAPFRLLAATLVALAFGLAAHAQPPPGLGGDHVKATLAPQTDGAAPGGVLYVAVVQQIEKGWPTYWKNPGDAGEPTRIIWTLPTGWR